MERYFAMAGGVIAVIAFVPTIFFLIRAVHQFILMLEHYRSERAHIAASLIPFAAIFMPHFFTEQGNVHRRAFISSLVRSIGCALIIAVLYAMLGIQSH